MLSPACLFSNVIWSRTSDLVGEVLKPLRQNVGVSVLITNSLASSVCRQGFSCEVRVTFCLVPLLCVPGRRKHGQVSLMWRIKPFIDKLRKWAIALRAV